MNIHESWRGLDDFEKIETNGVDVREGDLWHEELNEYIYIYIYVSLLTN